MLGSSILADVIDADELETGERKEGAYYSAYTFLYKTSSGIMAGITGLALGYVMNRLDFRVRSPRAVNLCHALYKSLGVPMEHNHLLEQGA